MKQLKKHILGLLICVIMSILWISTVIASENYNIVWSADDMELGVLTEYNGLSSVTGEDVSVTNSSRSYNNVTYNQTIKTNGYTTINNNYIPTKRALKFTTTQPCYITILAYGTSSGTTTQPMYISRSGSVVSELTLTHSVLTKNTIFLDSADTYYIYCLTGSVGVCYIQLYYIQGDLNADALVNKDDMTLLRQLLLDTDEVSTEVLNRADVNEDSVINELDFTLLSQLVSDYGNYVPTYYVNKLWVFDKYWNSNVISYTEQTDIDGLVVIPPENGVSGMCMRIGGEKYYNDIVYKTFIKTGGQMTLNDDKTAKQRSLSFFTSGPCNMTIFVRTSNTDTDNQPNITVTRKGEVVGQIDLLPSVEQSSEIMQVATIHLDKADQYYVGNTTGGLYIYCVLLTSENGKARTQLNLDKDEVAELIIEGVNLLDNNNYYMLEYDVDKVCLEKVKTQTRGSNYEKYDIIFSENVENVMKFDNGKYIFSIENEIDNWSGVVAILRFKALEDCSTVVSCIY